MQQRTLGQQGLATSAIGYGSMGITMAYGPSDEQESIAAIRQAHDLGVTMFDTAELYGWGEGEKILGRAVKGFRDEIVIASKFGFTPKFGLDSHRCAARPRLAPRSRRPHRSDPRFTQLRSCRRERRGGRS